MDIPITPAERAISAYCWKGKGMKFNGTYTIVNLKTGEYRTFRVKTQPKDSKFAPGKRIVALLRGPDNERSYEPFGFVNDDGIRVFKSKQALKWTKWQWFAMMLWDLATNGVRLKGWGEYELKIAKRCRICNRKLTTPESIDSGIGPICAAKR